MAQIQKPVQTVKVLDGQVFICSPIAANFTGDLPEPHPIKFPVPRLIRAVQGRMEHCMEGLSKAQNEGQIIRVETHDDITVVQFSYGECFHSGSYAAMESLLAKLEANKPLKEGLDNTQLQELLAAREADQLFKSWVMAGHPWDSRAALLDWLKDFLREQEKV